MKDIELKCNCGKKFIFTEGEQKFYAKKGFGTPKRCETCRLEKKQKKMNEETALESGKVFGECISCGFETVLVEEVGLCGPCCFGEADTINGNW